MEVYKRHRVVYSPPNPVTPISDQERISPYNIDTPSDTSDGNEEKYQIGDY